MDSISRGTARASFSLGQSLPPPPSRTSDGRPLEAPAKTKIPQQKTRSRFISYHNRGSILTVALIDCLGVVAGNLDARENMKKMHGTCVDDACPPWEHYLFGPAATNTTTFLVQASNAACCVPMYVHIYLALVLTTLQLTSPTAVSFGTDYLVLKQNWYDVDFET